MWYVLVLGYEFFLRDFRIHYRPAVLGVFWSVAPLVALTVTFASLRYGMNLPSENAGNPYGAYLLTGLIVWQVFADAVIFPLRLARRNRTLMRYVPFDYRALAVAALCYVSFNFLTKLPILVLAFIFFSMPISPASLLSLVPILALLGLGLGIGLFLTPVSLIYLDILYGTPYIVWALFAITPVVYSVPEHGFLQQINLANPLTHLITAARSGLLNGEGALSLTIFVGSLFCLFFLWMGLLYLNGRMSIGIERIFLRTHASKQRLSALTGGRE